MADAVITFTESRHSDGAKIDRALIVCDWLSATAGTGAATTTYAYTGHIQQALFVPDGAGTAPDNLYDITITDGTNDLLFGQGGNLPNDVSIALVSDMGYVYESTLTVNISGAGDANGGLIYIYIVR
ncbi:MAG: hypothetical protein KKH95_13160 [Gammaproteobacteria bacterium]|nr:hypothetical protein [Gammaproteobacteria bacterium]